MNDEKKYNEALERARKLYEQGTITESLCYVFSELKESEDRIKKKELIEFVKSRLAAFPQCDKYLTWIEKQGDKPVNIDIESIVSLYKQRLKNQGVIEDSPLVNMCLTSFRRGVEIVLEKLNLKKLNKQGKQTSDKVEPKFKVGDWVVSPNGVYWHIDKISNNRYEVTSSTGESSDWNLDTNIYHRFTIQDAKDGDVLIDTCDDYKNPLIFILKKFETVDFGLAKKSDYSSYCFLSMSYKPRFKEGYFHHMNDIKPATKEQRDTLMKAMTDAGYTFDFVKKELKKI